MRVSNPSQLVEFPFSKVQTRLDASSSLILEDCFNLQQVSSMTAGSFAFSFFNSFSILPRFLSLSAALLGEVTLYRATRQAFSHINSDFSAEDCFDAKGFLSDALSFSCLKGMRSLLQSSAFLPRHFISALSLSFTDSASQSLGFLEKNEETFLESFAQAFASSCALESSMHLFHGISGSKLQSLERRMHLSRAPASALAQIEPRIGENSKGLAQYHSVLGVSAALFTAYAAWKTRLPGITWNPKTMSGTRTSAWGSFELVKRGNVTFFEMAAKEGVPRLGTQIWIGGYATDHTAFAEMPRYLSDRGWDVKIAVFPFYEDHEQFSAVRGGGFTPFLLHSYLMRSMDGAIAMALRELPKNERVHFGGFSLGASAAPGIYVNLSEELRAKVTSLTMGGSGLILKKIPWKKYSMGRAFFNVYGSARAFMDSDMGQGRPPEVAPELQGEIHNLLDKSWFGAYTTYLLNENYTTRIRQKASQIQIPVVHIHGGKSDRHVSPENHRLLQNLLGRYLVEEEASEDGHWVFCSRKRLRYFERIHRVSSGDLVPLANNL